MRPILILCLGGESNSLLARALSFCGINFGNEHTYWYNHYVFPHMEHSGITGAMGMISSLKSTEVENEAMNTIRTILRSYKNEYESKKYALKTTSGICRNKWSKVKPIFLEEWPDVLFMAVVRKPTPEAYDGWGNVWGARKNIVEMGGIYLPFPKVFQNINMLRETFDLIGAEWNPEVESIYDGRHGKIVDYIEDDEKRQQYDYLMNVSAINISKLKERKNV